MNEEVGKVGGNRKKLIAGIVVAVLLAASIGAYLIFSKEGGSNYPYTIDLFWNTEYTENAWLVKVVDINKIPENQLDIHIGELQLILLNKTSRIPINYFLFTEMNSTTTTLGITFEDINGNSIVDIGDYLCIDRSGGSDGMIDPNMHELMLSDLGSTIHFYPSSVINLPPANFLDMDMQKTSDGWNMTVTWVNGAIPEGVMSDYNLTFRVENGSGEYFAGGEPGCDVSLLPEEYWRMRLSLIDSSIRNVSDVNYNYHDRDFYNITWFDNDENQQLSVNDTIKIDNYSGLVETGYRFRLICGFYGFMHSINESVLT